MSRIQAEDTPYTKDNALVREDGSLVVYRTPGEAFKALSKRKGVSPETHDVTVFNGEYILTRIGADFLVKR